MNISDALTAYRTYARAEGKSPKTVDWVVSSVGYFSDFLGPDKAQDIAGIKANDMRRFIIALSEKPKFSNHPYNKPQKQKLSPSAIDNYCRGVKSFFSFLKREGFIKANPLQNVKLPKLPEIIIPTLTKKELEKLLAQPDKKNDEGYRDYAIMLTFIDTTVRLGELIGLQDANIDFEQSFYKVMGKGARERYVPFGRKVARILMKYRVKHRPVPLATGNFWLRRDGQPLTAKRVEKLIGMYGKKAGIRVYPHLLRHTSSVMYLRNGGDVFSLQKKLGHRSLTMTRHYANLADADVRDQQLKYSVGDRLNL